MSGTIWFGKLPFICVCQTLHKDSVNSSHLSFRPISIQLHVASIGV